MWWYIIGGIVLFIVVFGMMFILGACQVSAAADNRLGIQEGQERAKGGGQ